jgi:pilus assembly protein CpaB
MNNSRRVTLIVAIALALVTGVLTLRYLTSLQQPAAPVAQTRQVIVAVKDIPARMKITADMIGTTTRQVADVDSDAISDAKQAVGSLALITIPAGSTLTTSKIGRPTDLAMPVRLQPGMRALTLSGDRVKAVSGFVQPGDRVDIIAIPPQHNGGSPQGVTILRGILVLAINSTMEQASVQTQSNGQQGDSNNTGDPATITVAVTPKEADLLAAVDQSIPLRLALRSPQEPVHSLPVESLTLPTEHVEAPAAPPPAPEYVAPPAAPAAMPHQPAPREGVTVIDGDKVVTGH